jgi:hypothetical protein
MFIAEPENGTAFNALAARKFHDRDRPLSVSSQLVGRPGSPYLNCGIVGAEMWGSGSGAILAAFPMPLGSTITLLTPPAFAGPGGIPLIGRFPDPAAPAIRANEAVGAAVARSNAKAIFTEVFLMLDIAKSPRDLL